MPARELTAHKVNGCNHELTVEAQDGPGPGGASHAYIIKGPLKDFGGGVGLAPSFGVNLRFQKGPIGEAGVNGISHETLLAILEDRLAGFQSGPYACPESASALAHIQAAQAVLKSRTEKRLARGVEGTHTV